MKNGMVRTLSPTQFAIQAGVIALISFVVFFFAACDSNAPSGQGDQNPLSGPQGSLSKTASVNTAAVPLGAASSFAVLGASTVTNTGATVLNGDAGVSPGTAMTGFLVAPGPVTFLSGAIHAGDSLAAQAHSDAVTAYNALVALPCTFNYGAVQELNNLVLTPGVHCFPSSAHLNGTLVLDFQGNSNAAFIFDIGSTLVTVTGSKVIVINNGGQTCNAANVYWAVGSSATLGTGTQFVGNILAVASITITTGVSMSGSALALNGAVTLDTDTVSVCSSSSGGGPFPKPCRDFVTGGGWIKGSSNGKATFGVSGGIKHGKFWGQLSFNDHGRNSVKVKGTSVTAYFAVDPVTRHIEGTAKINGRGNFTYKVDVVDNSEHGHNDSFSLELSNGYNASGTLKGGNIQIHTKCGDSHDKDGDDDKENYDDKDERDGHHNCDNDNDHNWD